MYSVCLHKALESRVQISSVRSYGKKCFYFTTISQLVKVSSFANYYFVPHLLFDALLRRIITRKLQLPAKYCLINKKFHIYNKSKVRNLFFYMKLWAIRIQQYIKPFWIHRNHNWHYATLIKPRAQSLLKMDRTNLSLLLSLHITVNSCAFGVLTYVHN